MSLFFGSYVFRREIKKRDAIKEGRVPPDTNLRQSWREEREGGREKRREGGERGGEGKRERG